MSLTVEQTDRVPLVAGTDGVVRVAGTRVTLDTVAEAFHQGATAEEVLQQYPSLTLADVYSVFAYLLRHQQAVGDYLEKRRKQRDAVRGENERRFAPEGVRSRLAARHA